MLKITMIPLRLALLFLLLLFGQLTACSNSTVALGENNKQQPLEHLSAMHWQLVSIRRGRDNPVSGVSHDVPLKRYHLYFEDGRMRLRGGCNSVNGAVKITTPGKMQVGPMVMTNRGCNTKLMRADSEIGQTLSYVTHYRLDERYLAMLGAKRILLFEGAPKPKQQEDNASLLRKARFW